METTRRTDEAVHETEHFILGVYDDIDKGEYSILSSSRFVRDCYLQKISLCVICCKIHVLQTKNSSNKGNESSSTHKGWRPSMSNCRTVATPAGPPANM
jgi:hypothetical protein